MVSRLLNEIKFVILGMTLLLVSCNIVKASNSSIVSFTYGYIWGSLEFPEEAHPTETILCNLTVDAYIEVNIYNFTLEISGLIGQGWQSLRTEQIISHHMAQGENLTFRVMIVLPPNTNARLRCIIEASTDKGFGKTAFYATQVSAVTYTELSILYDELLTNYSRLHADHDQLLANYTNLNLTYQSLSSQYNATQAAYNSLNSSYESLNATYNSVKSDHDSLQEYYNYIKEKYDSSTAELSIVRNLMFGFGIATAILAATTIYFKKKAPYIVLRKETVAKPDN